MWKDIVVTLFVKDMISFMISHAQFIFFPFCLYLFAKVVPFFYAPKGFPLDKAVSYAKLRNPLLINDLNMQYYIQDRYE